LDVSDECCATVLTSCRAVLCCGVQGLGKTLQSITFLAHLKWVMNVPGPHLVVVPLSVMSSWMSELARWVLCLGRNNAVAFSWVGDGSGSGEEGD
jgi:hypothetical protein